uniref:Prolyl 3-hydroxylase family member 4 (inactive) n=1 Tax=Amphilophus citrinellus TaxID=61819 RepID=A0A3Q0RV80_AMPCI
MATLRVKGDSLVTLLFVTFVFMTDAQYENYKFRNFPKEDLVPLTAAYGKALDYYAAENWTESIQYLELSLRLHRLRKDSARHCVRHCKTSKHDEESFAGDPDLRICWHVMMRATCQKKCRTLFLALQLPPPSLEILEDFNRRYPYRYLHFAHSKLNDLQRAVPCAHTFLQRNPDDQEMQQLMEEYKSQYDLSGYLIDYEERPYESSFLRGVKLVGSGDYSSGVQKLEAALWIYLQEYDLCQAECEGVTQLSPDGDFYAVIAVNDGRSAVPCAYSYFLFEPEDPVMKQNLQYYKAYSQQWGLQSNHFTPRTEAFKHYNQTITQKKMLAFAETYLDLAGEVRFMGKQTVCTFLLISTVPYYLI